MAEPEDLTLVILREIRADVRESRENVSRMDQSLQEVRRTLARHELRFDALDEKFELLREATVSAVGYAANASRAHVDLRRQINAIAERSAGFVWRLKDKSNNAAAFRPPAATRPVNTSRLASNPPREKGMKTV